MTEITCDKCGLKYKAKPVQSDNNIARWLGIECTICPQCRTPHHFVLGVSETVESEESDID
jgi:hypothetical protein